MYKEVIKNPVTGEIFYVLESNKDVFRVEYFLRPGAAIPAEHFHPHQEQTIKVLDGALKFHVNGEERLVEAGDSITIPAGTAHYLWNPTRKLTYAIDEIKPAGRAHNMFRVLFALAREGKTDSKGVPKPLIGAAFVSEFADVVRVTSFGLRLLFGTLAPISRLLGYDEIIRDYIDRFEKEDEEKTIEMVFPQRSTSGSFVRKGAV